MSTIIMAACWPLKMPPTPKAVLISLADNANDHGVCWPSLSKISARTCFGRTAVIEAIQWLEEQGYLVADRTNGRHTTYTVKVPSGDLFVVGQPVRQANRSASRTGAAAESDPSASRTGPVRQADTNRKEPSGTVTNTQQRAAAGCRFDEFWKVYPTKVGRKPALTKWKAKHLDEIADTLIADVRKRIAEDGRWLEGFIPNPSTYLTQERWTDELQPRRDARPAPPSEPRRYDDAEATRAAMEKAKARNPMAPEKVARAASEAIALIQGRAQ